MSDELPDELSRLYRYVKQWDRRITKLRHMALFRRPILSAHIQKSSAPPYPKYH